MHFSPLILPLATVASAIDIRFFSGMKCNVGAFRACGNINPESCCHIDHKANSVGFFAVPVNWHLVTRSYVDKKGTLCFGDDKANEFNSNGATTVCHGTSGIFPGNYRGAGYSFIDKRRATDTSDKQACVKPNLLVLEDGKKYKIDELDNDLTEHMVCCPT
jgi:hypothetical protein